MTLQPGKQTISIHIFLEKSYTKCGGETIPRPFSKKSKLSIDQQFKALCSLILLCVEGYQTILKSRCRALAFISYKAFFKKTRCGTTIPASYSVLCLKKNIYLATFYYLTKLYCLAAFTSWDIGQYAYCNCLLTRLWRHKFWN